MDCMQVAETIKPKLVRAIGERQVDKIEQYLGALEKLSLPAAVIVHTDIGKLVNSIRQDKVLPEAVRQHSKLLVKTWMAAVKAAPAASLRVAPSQAASTSKDTFAFVEEAFPAHADAVDADARDSYHHATVQAKTSLSAQAGSGAMAHSADGEPHLASAAFASGDAFSKLRFVGWTKPRARERAVYTLVQLCQRTLTRNIAMLDDVGLVPLDLLMPVFAQCTGEQLARLEAANPQFGAAAELQDRWRELVIHDFEVDESVQCDDWREEWRKRSEDARKAEAAGLARLHERYKGINEQSARVVGLSSADSLRITSKYAKAPGPKPTISPAMKQIRKEAGLPSGRPSTLTAPLNMIRPVTRAIPRNPNVSVSVRPVGVASPAPTSRPPLPPIHSLFATPIAAPRPPTLARSATCPSSSSPQRKPGASSASKPTSSSSSALAPASAAGAALPLTSKLGGAAKGDKPAGALKNVASSAAKAATSSCTSQPSTSAKKTEKGAGAAAPTTVTATLGTNTSAKMKRKSDEVPAKGPTKGAPVPLAVKRSGSPLSSAAKKR